MLEVYQPGSFDDVFQYLESDTPFMAISRGDIVNPGLWDGSQSPMKVLRVVNVEHIIWKNETTGGARHKVLVFTEEVEGTRELRTSHPD